MPGVIDAENVRTQDRAQTSPLDDIYIAVFFDGTSNNMVRQMYVDDTERDELEKEKKELSLIVDYINPILQSEVSVDDLNRFNAAQDRIAEIDQILKEQENNSEYVKIQELRKRRREILNKRNKRNTDDIASEPDTTNKEIEEIENELEKINVYNKILTKQLSQARTNGYSNVAILYSLFNDSKKTSDSNCAIHHLYIEGAGATDISKEESMDVDGLGFGLGFTGVTALTSKAIRYVTNYLNSQGANISQDTKLHFYIFGFSRGSACARLFANLITRKKGERIVRESEFTEFLTNDYFVNNRLAFLEADAGKNSFDITKENITVDYLGIYDTVVSIGLLKQKDGYVDSIASFIAKNKEKFVVDSLITIANKVASIFKQKDDCAAEIASSIEESYKKGNWHYLNASEYGLYSPQNGRVLHTLHLGALDEFRENFAFTNIGSTLQSNCLEIMIPGCHSDVGGGYVDCLEQEIILHKETENDGKSINTYISKLSPHISPHKKDTTGENSSDIGIIDNEKVNKLSLEAFYKLGWLDENWDKDNAKKIDVSGNTVSCTTRAVENDDNGFHHIKFRRNVKRGYSDIPLAMMLKYYESCGCLPLFEPIPDEYNYTKNSDLQVLGNNMMKHVMSPPVPGGRRIWLYPGGSYDSPTYKMLRMKYLHFTSTGRIVHFNFTMPFINQTGPIHTDSAGANFGNKPNFDLNGVLCRINYDGDEAKPDSFKSGVKYLYDLDGEVKSV